jgi:hypothetical protein
MHVLSDATLSIAPTLFVTFFIVFFIFLFIYYHYYFFIRSYLFYCHLLFFGPIELLWAQMVTPLGAWDLYP